MALRETKTEGERGAVAVVFALVLVILVGMLAFVVDVAMVRAERANAQSAADSGALAAAWKYCAGSTPAQAEAEGKSVASLNGYSGAQVTYSADTDSFRTTIDGLVVEARFAPVLGGGDLQTGVTALASARCSGPMTLPLFHAHSSTCGDQGLQLSSIYFKVTGGAESNSNIRISNGSGEVDGQWRVVGNHTLTSGYVAWKPATANPQKVPGPMPWPIEYAIEDFQPSRLAGTPKYYSTDEVITKDWLIKKGHFSWEKPTLSPGIYYSSKGVNLQGFNLSASSVSTVTFVTPGKIEVASADLNIKPYVDDLLFFSGYEGGCDEWGIYVHDSSAKLKGVLFAPKSQVRASSLYGAGVPDLALFGNTVKVTSGSWFSKAYTTTSTSKKAMVRLEQ